MTARGEYTSGDGLIDASVFPIRSDQIDTGWLEDQEAFCRRTGAHIGQTATTLHDQWLSTLPASYQAPESARLARAMRPVADRGDHEQETWHAAARQIYTFTQQIGPLRRQLQQVEFAADELRNRVASGVLVTADDVADGRVDLEPAQLAAWYDGAKTSGYVLWHQHRPTVERNDGLVSDARRLTDAIRTARDDLGRALRNLNDGGVVGEGLVGSGSPGRLMPGNLTGTSLDPADISWFAPDQKFLDHASPGEIREWWDGLSPWQRRALTAGMPLVIGNLNGIPLGVRARANRINIRNEVQRLENEIDRMDAEISAARSPGSGRTFDGSLTDAQQLQDERDRLRQTARNYRDYLELPAPRNRYGRDGELLDSPVTSATVLAFDPLNQSIATYSGPLDADGDIPGWVENIAVHVPGTTTTVEGYNGTDDRGYELYDAANQKKLGADPTAIITWSGGPQPQGVDAAWDGYSRDLGPKLHDFVEGVKQPGDSTLTVTGHSYGAATVGQAEAGGLEADRVLYVSGAGLGNDNDAVADFPETGDAPHYSLIARNDAITGSSQNADAGPLGHGASPQDDPDVLRLETGFQQARNPDSGTIEDFGPIGAHSGVYTPGSTAFNNIVGVITGTEAIVYTPDQFLGKTYDGYSITRDGINDPDYEPHVIDVDDYEDR